MLSGSEALARSVVFIEQAPESANALTLYALANTLEYERAGCLFKLVKLRDMDAAARALAYGLMELVAEERVGDDAWKAAKARMDRAIRGV
ncbi:MAG: hypothetical protein GVY09_09655 [Gammaproteobacteria bacterium]|nr:hypothetical protein [Gammaproteobacteria bacterium]